MGQRYAQAHGSRTPRVSKVARAAAWGPGAGPAWIRHCPPVVPCTGFLDWVPKKMQRVGCVELLNTVQRRVQPRLHVFGHIHEGQWVREGAPLFGPVAAPLISLLEGNSPFLTCPLHPHTGCHLLLECLIIGR